MSTCQAPGRLPRLPIHALPICSLPTAPRAALLMVLPCAPAAGLTISYSRLNRF
jgi:hypothetical protein